MDQKSDEYDCPICFNILYKPFTLHCKHTFCQICFDQMTFIEPNFIKCPVCRQKFLRKDFLFFFNKELDNKIFEAYQNEYKLRAINFIEINKIKSNKRKVILTYGNTHKFINNKHEISFFVKMNKENIRNYVKKIELDFFPQLGLDSIVLRNPPFEIKKNEEKEFFLTFKIFWNKNIKTQPCSLEYKVSFEDPIRNYYFVLEIDEKDNKKEKKENS